MPPRKEPKLTREKGTRFFRGKEERKEKGVSGEAPRTPTKGKEKDSQQ